MDENNSNNELDNELEENDKENVTELNDNIQKVEINNTKEIKKIKKETEKVKYVEKKDKKKDKNRRNRDKEIVVQYRKPSIFSSILLILIGIMIATIALLILYIFKGKREVVVYKEPETTVENFENEDNTIDEPEEKELDLSLNGEFVQNLYDKIPLSFHIQDTYSWNKTTEANLTGIQKMLFVLENMRKKEQYEELPSDSVIDRLEQNKITDTSGMTIAQVQKFESKDVSDYYKSVFSSSLNIIKEDIDTGMGYIYEYDKQDDCFYGHGYAGGGGTSIFFDNMIDSVEISEDKKEIYIYDYFIKVRTNYDDVTYVYTYSNVENSIGQETDDYSDYYSDETKVTNLFEKYKNNGLIKFKHTYKLDTNGDYYWYCCEPTK